MEEIKIGLLSDTHGNLPALKSCLAELSKHNCTYIVHLGDIISIGAFSKQCAEILLNAQNLFCVMGNHDKGFVKKFDKQTANSYVSQAHKQHVYATLGEEIRQQMQGLPYVLYKTHFGIKFAFTHYARYEDETFYEIDKFPTEQKYDDMYSNISADVIIFGHTHKSGYFKGKSEYINIPSIGCRAGDTAYCAVLTITQEKTLSLKEISLPYDKQALFEEMDKQNLPDKETMKQYYFNFKP